MEKRVMDEELNNILKSIRLQMFAGKPFKE